MKRILMLMSIIMLCFAFIIQCSALTSMTSMSSDEFIAKVQSLTHVKSVTTDASTCSINVLFDNGYLLTIKKVECQGSQLLQLVRNGATGEISGKGIIDTSQSKDSAKTYNNLYDSIVKLQDALYARANE